MKQGLYPAPVYVATLESGETVRVSFWSPAGKPLDFTRGRNAAALIYARPDGAPIASRQWRFYRKRTNTVREHNGKRRTYESFVPSSLTRANYCPSPGTLSRMVADLGYWREETTFHSFAPARVVSGFVEWNGETLLDPFFNPEAAPKAEKKNWRKLAAQAREALESGNATAALELLKAA